ncbi:hypothetical protein J4G43_047135 [Bradyrhizobium barranii subsp. barranii]|uniref:Uncharacterized protein n=1 Tax=Bradyrhizobium barranii subsp. barranii TaxID=2823807 RepID=A0A939MJ67_9BRAD|nr:hypothetical protein [Bradyrhizobium barranii]UEM11942.1 hypothetical protein J4G43_047135 [Bradyrhizobium barranii subsp. barranii]
MIAFAGVVLLAGFATSHDNKPTQTAAKESAAPKANHRPDLSLARLDAMRVPCRGHKDSVKGWTVDSLSLSDDEKEVLPAIAEVLHKLDPYVNKSSTTEMATVLDGIMCDMGPLAEGHPGEPVSYGTAVSMAANFTQKVAALRATK